MTLTSLQLFHPSLFRSFSTVRRHVVFGRPTARLNLSGRVIIQLERSWNTDRHIGLRNETEILT